MQLTIEYMDLHVGTSCVIELLVTKKIKYPWILEKIISNNHRTRLNGGSDIQLEIIFCFCTSYFYCPHLPFK
jgi:hypothetical protein